MRYMRVTRKGSRVLSYALKTTSKRPKRVPFYEDFALSMQRELVRGIPLAACAHAMATRLAESGPSCSARPCSAMQGPAP